MSERKLAFLGLGVMGFPMAGHLARAGHDVTVYNRTPAKAGAGSAQHGGTARADAAPTRPRGAELVLMCVGNDDDVRAVAARRRRRAGRRWRRARSWSTTRPRRPRSRARSTRAAAARGVGFLDAPVSGGQAGAENGKLTIMVGGDAAAFAARRAGARATTRARSR